MTREILIEIHLGQKAEGQTDTVVAALTAGIPAYFVRRRVVKER